MRNRAIFAAALGGLILSVSGCTERQFQPGYDDDTIAPSVSLVKTAGDTLKVADGIRFGISAADNLGLKTLSIALSGGYNGTVDTTFTTAVTTVALAVKVELPSNTPAGGMIYLTATATDGADNSGTAQDSVFLLNQSALTVSVVRPSTGAVTSQGRQIVVEVRAQHAAGVKTVGFTAAGVVTDSAARSYSSPLPTEGSLIDTVTVPANASQGTFTVSGFATDSTGRTATSAAVSVTVQAVTNDTDPPRVSFKVSPRVEVDDSIKVTATDPSGITRMGWYALLRDDTTQRVGGAELTYGGTLTDVTETWPLSFTFTTSQLPRYVVLRAYAVDAAGNGDTTATASASPPAGAARRAPAAAASDTVLVVHGITTPLPNGGRIIDGIYNRNLNEVYLTNVELGRLEVFRVADTSFVAGGVPTGSRPWGIALWPRDRNGNNADTVVVANSGGTDLSIVDMRLRREVRRHALPNFLVDEIHTEMDDQTGTLQIKYTRHEFSDRPQYLGMTWRAANAILAVYSTTPTIDQDEYPERGSLRWENLTSATPQSHLFWEHAQMAASPDLDTLRVIVDRRGTQDEVLAASCGVMVEMEQLVFRNKTFVRNSGDFTHAMAGEGGVVEGKDFAQAVAFSADSAVQVTACNFGCTSYGVCFGAGFEYRDRGVSKAEQVSDFISNTATIVTSIAINFNGLTNLVRTTDSVYVLDDALRLRGLIAEEGTNTGMDLNFDHNFTAGVGGTPTYGGTGDPNDRLVFLAVEDPEIEVYDTYFFAKVKTLPIRDPIIGPLRVARLASGDQILVGVTVNGVVTIQLSAIANPLPTDSWSDRR